MIEAADFLNETREQTNMASSSFNQIYLSLFFSDGHFCSFFKIFLLGEVLLFGIRSEVIMEVKNMHGVGVS